ncbi:putative oxidoreductase [Lachnellula suecica]|uniref:Putative oxidoreductase n=1 Tax=Lachnellula suecica TaxID=602035 RepID=A0A8T9CLI2_9HELO|nr:putative oxidoreductase [Lachnellula suecica]
MPQLTWLITGCSSGFGEGLALDILKRGDRVIATGRGKPERLDMLKQAGAAVLELDVCSSQADLDARADEALKIYEESRSSNDRLLASFNTNLFDAVNLTRAVLPHFRQKKAGILVFMGSIGGWQGEVGAGAYSATKFAMEEVVECLQKETSGFSIRSVIFEPSHYRTKVMHGDNVKFEPLKVSEYSEINIALVAGVKGVDGSQPGDLKLAANLIVDIIKREGAAKGKEIPPRFPIGPVGYQQLRDKCLATFKLLEEWETQIMNH